MKKTTPYLFLLLAFSTLISCKTGTRALLDLDTRKTTALIADLLNDISEKFSPFGCISENGLGVTGNNLLDFRKSSIASHLELTDSMHYETQLKLHLNFKLTPKIVPNKKIIPEETHYKLYFMNMGAFENWVNTECGGAYCSIAKPIFNEAFNLAIVKYLIYYKDEYGDNVGYEATKIYTYKNRKWVEKSHLHSTRW